MEGILLGFSMGWGSSEEDFYPMEGPRRKGGGRVGG